MTEAQLAAFQAASQSKPETVSLLVLSLFSSVMLLWCAWTLLIAWQGVCRQRLSWQSFGAVAARSLLLVLVSFWLVLS
ncbi:TIGR03758 family integrating conjugative element protein [Klebsiella pneumoniae]|uniref:TIGR03758 family integrating conjugative element protein n=1 Tax=Enterobacter quasiroggenkampii TaxID=2497436 RepID=UPI000F84DE22|nr:TIGR03758 family integrating conjugative element protein [Enterobacter quasiroggenkampii]EKX4007257.1 TIGR03758 family integrating conjugative element protein [Enterobacter cloacae]MEA4464961.1 TIGR03758 family integrating conjugative element protein [Klebsiella pneumoniae]MEA4505684.1 TIGR03758 family integrating conjugative element protein [Klebsiella pneumoniae]RTM78894.1 TIGR03758 family integrating conjugative element protein [Enterobacter quasiroggenkampii]HBS7933988.1 TIGR03758 famil